MAQQVVLKGAEIKVYISGKLYPNVQSLSYTVNYEEEEIYGIDSMFPQEIATNKVSCSGSIVGIVIKHAGGLQGANARPKTKDILKAPYTSLRIQNRQNGKDILWLPQMKVSSEKMDVTAKGVAKLSFSFKGIIPYFENDMA